MLKFHVFGAIHTLTLNLIWSQYCLYFQICVSSKMCLETVYTILGFWNYPLSNILGVTGCHIANLLRLTGILEIQLHSFIMSTTRYILLFHDNLLLRFNLTAKVSETICIHLNSNMSYSLLIYTWFLKSLVYKFDFLTGFFNWILCPTGFFVQLDFCRLHRQ